MTHATVRSLQHLPPSLAKQPHGSAFHSFSLSCAYHEVVLQGELVVRSAQLKHVTCFSLLGVAGNSASWCGTKKEGF